MNLDFNKMKREEVYVNRQKYVFYIREDNSYNTNRGLTIQVSEDNQILNIYSGTFRYLDNNILTISDNADHYSYYNINSGEQLFKQYDNLRCYNSMVNGIALIYDDKINNYIVINSNGDIVNNVSWLYRINNDRILVHKNRCDKFMSLYDYKFNLIKEDVTLHDYYTGDYNKDYIVCCKFNGKRKEYFLVDINGNVITKEYSELKTKDFNIFKVKNSSKDKVVEMSINDLLKDV